MKIGIVGTFIRDRIFPWQGEPTESIGGLYFTVSYVANLVSRKTEILPICFIGADFSEKVRDALVRHSNVSFDGVITLDRDNTCVQLTYTGPQEREEVTTSPMPPIGIEELKVVADADAIIVNLITGFDVGLPALAAFRRVSDALVYLDFHSRTLGISETGKRFYRYPDDWQNWMQYADIVQLNEMEARTIGRIAEGASLKEVEALGHKVLKMGPGICHITLEERGSLLFYSQKNEGRQPRVQSISVPQIPKVVDVIGCGDAFEAAFMTQYLEHGNLVESTEFAHKVAAANCTFIGSSQINDIQMILQKLDAGN